MRVIAGSAGGRPLVAPRGRATRPTADRVREALFSSVGGELDGALVLDLYAGSGALAIEALSRGAEHAVLVDHDERALQAVRANLNTARMAVRATVIAGDAARYARDPARRPGPFSLVLLDPPYAEALPAVLGLVGALRAAAALAPGALVVVERDRRDAALSDPPPRFLRLERDRTYGDTVLRYLRVLDEEEPGP